MTVNEIESAIKKLPPKEISKLSEWFEKFEAQMWDEQIASDLEWGKFRTLIDEAEMLITTS
jgi:hypothetical protein